MPPRSVDIVAAGPPSPDLYDPAAPAWALASGLAARGHSVQVAFPGPKDGPPPPEGISAAPFTPVTAHLGTYLGDAELARSAGHRIRPTADVVIRDPAGVGALGHRASRRGVVAFVRTLAADAVGTSPPEAPARRFGSSLFSWGERRSVRRLEREALAEATMVYCSNGTLKQRLHDDYGVAPERLRVGLATVARGPEAPARAAGRRTLGVPDDVLLTVVLPPVDPGIPGPGALAVEAFRRTRPIFAGTRLAVLGAGSVSGPGIVSVPSRDAAAITAAVAAADVGIALPAGPAPDPGLALALRAGLATIVGTDLELGEGSEKAVRRAATADPGELASVLAELLADPEERRSLGEAARTLAQRFDPVRLAEELETTGALGRR